MQTVTHHGRTTAYREGGGDDGPLTIYIHGSGGNHTLWTAQLERSTGHPVVALDLSGHGQSDDVDTVAGHATMAAYGEDVLAVANATNADAFVGNSLGGAILLHLALDADEFDPLGIVLSDTGAKLSVEDKVLAWLEDDFDRAIDYFNAPNHHFHDPSSADVGRVTAVMKSTGQRVTRRDLRTLYGFDVRDRLGAVSVPTLALAGEYDKLTPVWFHEYLANNIPGAELAIVNGGAHLCMVEVPVRFDATVSDFFTGLE